MNIKLIFWPMFVQLFMSLFLYIPLVRSKIAAVKNKQVDRKAAALNSMAWPEAVQKIDNNLRNQFQSPMLFYVLCITIYVTQQTSVTLLCLAWAYVISRIGHMLVHTRSNYVPWRMRIFAVGISLLLVMAIMVLVGL